MRRSIEVERVLLMEPATRQAVADLRRFQTKARIRGYIIAAIVALVIVPAIVAALLQGRWDLLGGFTLVLALLLWGLAA